MENAFVIFNTNVMPPALSKSIRTIEISISEFPGIDILVNVEVRLCNEKAKREIHLGEEEGEKETEITQSDEFGLSLNTLELPSENLIVKYWKRKIENMTLKIRGDDLR